MYNYLTLLLDIEYVYSKKNVIYLKNVTLLPMSSRTALHHQAVISYSRQGQGLFYFP